MKLFNYLLLFLLFPFAHYAAIEDDLVQLVIVFEDINTLLFATKKENLETLKNNVQEAINYFSATDISFANYSKFSSAMGDLKKAIDEEIQQESTRTEKLFEANWLDEFRKKYFIDNVAFYRIFASYVLMEYPKITVGKALMNPQEIDEILKKNVEFFEIQQPLPEDKAKILESILDKYLNLLDNSMEDQQFSKDMEEIQPQQMLSDFLELINDNPTFKALINTANYSRARNLLSELNKRYPDTAMPVLEPRENPVPQKTEQIKEN